MGESFTGCRGSCVRRGGPPCGSLWVLAKIIFGERRSRPSRPAAVPASSAITPAGLRCAASRPRERPSGAASRARVRARSQLIAKACAPLRSGMTDLGGAANEKGRSPSPTSNAAVFSFGRSKRVGRVRSDASCGRATERDSDAAMRSAARLSWTSAGLKSHPGRPVIWRGADRWRKGTSSESSPARVAKSHPG
jgi:hypothetical protein